ncbi:thiamine-phosphate kinase [Paenarthrobacter sp. Z7-10]|uniref:thiamine-phosphate kinase n=1 Tax=Paenarthrobacter sp. Z7-10 TaxID=2787635 RepID=UPI0022A9EA83|nr:thiamine-phosphate kinase [Paenarthrobacter sp. Z7-10]MCZ2403455.1 thiamine-phosphate kinase [Paenarthrobacter sp. Z7-10]
MITTRTDGASQSAVVVGELDEGALLARIFPRLAGSASVLLGPGDDAAVVAAPDGRTVVSIDTQVQDLDFRLLWPNGYRSTGYDVGWKAAAQNLSDINAMGAVATSLVVSLNLPAGTLVSWVEELAEGLSAAIAGLGAEDCSVAGGDLSGGREIVVTVAVLGNLQGRDPVLRSGARVGDIVALAGTVGRAAAGWALLEGTTAVAELNPEQDAVVELFCRPRPPLAAGPAAARAGATAMLDISDGLLRDGGRLAKASNVVVDLDPAALEPFAAPLRAAADLLGMDPWGWILGGGEDHGLLCTFPAGSQLPHGFVAIGSVMAGGDGLPPVTIAGEAAHSAEPQTAGWDHFAL